jgi:hypothetical protein
VGWLTGMDDTTSGEETPAFSPPATEGPSRWELYEILGIDTKNVSLDELRLKRKKLALRYHPDRNQGDDTAQVLYFTCQSSF